MFIAQDSKLTTVIIWVSTIIIFLLLALLALMGGILYSKQKSGGDVQVNIMPGVSAEAEQTTVAPPAQVRRPAAQPEPAAPGKGGEKVYVLINGKLVPLDLKAINQLAQQDRDMQQAQQAARKARAVVAAETATIDEQTAQQAVAHAGSAEHVRTGDGNKVVLTQAKYGRGLQSQLQLMGMAAVDLIKREGGGEATTVAQKLESVAEQTKKKMRYVRVKAGDSLWRIAVRAYGDGFKYERILEANPQLKNPNRLEVGMLLRVPL